MTVTDPTDIKAIIRRDIGRRIQQHRRQAGLSQTALALQLGTQSGEVSRWETGHRRPSPETIGRIADVFGIDWRILEYGTADESPDP